MRIAVTIDEVLRDTLMQLVEVYEKYEIGTGNYESIDDIKSKDYAHFFPIKDGYTDVKNINDFLYTKHSFEVFGAASFMSANIMDSINEFIFDFYFDEGNTFTILSKEHNRSIPATLYFLAKTNIATKDIKFVDTYNGIWDQFDVIITAEPTIIESVPENKTVIKINAPYNQELETEHEFDDINSVFSSIDLEKL